MCDLPVERVTSQTVAIWADCPVCDHTACPKSVLKGPSQLSNMQSARAMDSFVQALLTGGMRGSPKENKLKNSHACQKKKVEVGLSWNLRIYYICLEMISIQLSIVNCQLSIPRQLENPLRGLYSTPKDFTDPQRRPVRSPLRHRPFHHCQLPLKWQPTPLPLPKQKPTP